MNVRKMKPAPRIKQLDWVQVDMSMEEAAMIAQFLIEKGLRHEVANDLYDRLVMAIHSP